MQPIRAVKWSFASQLAYILFYFAINIVLSRILPPADFGTFAIVNIFIGFASTVKDFGLGNYLINKQQLTPEIKDKVFFFNVVFVMFLCILLVVLAPLISRLFKDPRLNIFVPLSCIALLIDGLATVPNAMLIRELNFYKLFIVRVVSIIAAGTVAIFMGFNGFGIYSLIAQSIVFSTVGALLVFSFKPFLPRKTTRVGWREIFSFSAPLFFDQIVQYWTRNVDNLVVGKVYGSYSLGIYNRAYTLMQMPVQNISTVISKVLFPVLSKHQSDRARVGDLYARVLKVIALFSFPLMCFVFVFADMIIHVLYGHAWDGVIPILRIFALVGLIESVLSPTGSLFLSFGKTMKLLRINTAVRMLSILMILLGSIFSVKAVAYFYLVATIVNTPIIFFFVGREIDRSVWQLLFSLVPVLFISVASAGFVWMLRQVLETFSGISEIYMCCLFILFFGLAYLTLSFLLTRQNFNEAYLLISSQKTSK